MSVLDRYPPLHPQAMGYKSLFPQAGVITTDFSQLESKVMAKLMKTRNFDKSFKHAMYYGTSVHNMWEQWYKQGIDVMPRTLFSFHPARNNQVTRTNVQTLAQLQEALDDNPDFTHISVVNDGKAWLIHKGPISAKSSTQHGKWKEISVKRLPKPIKMLLVIQPLGE